MDTACVSASPKWPTKTRPPVRKCCLRLPLRCAAANVPCKRYAEKINVIYLRCPSPLRRASPRPNCVSVLFRVLIYPPSVIFILSEVISHVLYPQAGAVGLFDRFHHDFFFLNSGCPDVVCTVSPVSALRMIAKRAIARSSPWSAARTYQTLASRGFRRQPMPISVK